MKPGYYLSEKGNFQVWYPFGFFDEHKQRLDVVLEDGREIQMDYTRDQLKLIKSIIEFEFIGGL